MTYAVLMLSLLAPSAHAWKHTGQAWPTDEFQFCIVDGGLTLANGSAVAEAEAAIDAWDEGPVGRFTLASDCTPDTTGVIWIELGVTNNAPNQGAVLTGDVLSIGGDDYEEVDGWHIQLNPDIDWVSYEDVRSGDCAGQANLRQILVHEIGHAVGLGHSCDEGEGCGIELLEAVMYWTAGPCDPDVTPQADDLASLAALYDTSVEPSTFPSIGVPATDSDADRSTGSHCSVTNRIPGGSWLFVALLLWRRRR